MRFAVLVAFLGLTSWLAVKTEARADDMPYCGDIQGTYCPQPGYITYCYITWGEYAVCTCSEVSHGWWC
jgi:hypothetical protein